MPPTPLPSEMLSLDVAPTQHLSYARDLATTAFASATVDSSTPESYMSITTSPKFNKHSFEVYLFVLGIFCADTLILDFVHFRSYG